MKSVFLQLVAVLLVVSQSLSTFAKAHMAVQHGARGTAVEAPHFHEFWRSDHHGHHHRTDSEEHPDDDLPNHDSGAVVISDVECLGSEPVELSHGGSICDDLQTSSTRLGTDSRLLVRGSRPGPDSPIPRYRCALFLTVLSIRC